jgi:hypothetical protein
LGKDIGREDQLVTPCPVNRRGNAVLTLRQTTADFCTLHKPDSTLAYEPRYVFPKVSEPASTPVLGSATRLVSKECYIPRILRAEHGLTLHQLLLSLGKSE